MAPRITTHRLRAVLGHHSTDFDTVSAFGKVQGNSRDSSFGIK